MAQTYNGGPLIGTLASSLEIRQNNNAFLTNNSGPSLPGYATLGMTWFDEVTNRLNVVKGYGSMPWQGLIDQAGNNLNLGWTLNLPGEDGTLVNTNIKVRTDLGGPDINWEYTPNSPVYTGGELVIDFNWSRSPSYYMARDWDDPVIGEPVLWSADGRLLNKNWIDPVGTSHDVLINGSMQNDAPFQVDTLRPVDLEMKHIHIPFTTTQTSVIDHAVFALPAYGPAFWWEWQSAIKAMSMVRYDFYENGILRTPETYKIVGFMWGGVPTVAVYNRVPGQQVLAPFAPGTHFEIRIQKDR